MLLILPTTVRTAPDCRPADGDPEFERPALLDGEEEPHDDPEEEVEDGGDHAREHGAVEGSLAEDYFGVNEIDLNRVQNVPIRCFQNILLNWMAHLVDEGEVVEEGGVAHGQRDEHAHGRAVGEVRPERSSRQDDRVLLALALDERHELVVAVHVDHARRGGHDGGRQLCNGERVGFSIILSRKYFCFGYGNSVS